MKKLTLLLVVLAALAVTPAFADITTGTAEYDFPGLGNLYGNGGGPVAFSAPDSFSLNTDPAFLSCTTW